MWHPQLGIGEDATRKSVEAVRGQRADIAWTLKLKPEVKIRRAPASGQRGY